MHRNRVIQKPETNGSSRTSCQTVYIIDPDDLSAEFVARIAETRKLNFERFESGEAFWDASHGRGAGCIVMEVELPGMSGIQLQQRMSVAGINLPIVMVTGEADVAVAVRAMKCGACDFLQKPCHPLELWEAMQAALEKDRLFREAEARRKDIQARLQALTDDEVQVMNLALEGEAKKTIARRLDLSLRTIDFRRAKILKKMGARSLLEVAQMLSTVDGGLDFARDL